MKPKTPKKLSLAKVAKTYKKNHADREIYNEGARFFDKNAMPYAIGNTTSRNTYKPKAKSITLGGTRANKGATIKKKGKI